MEVLAQYPDVPSQLTGNQDLLTWQTWVISVGAAGFTVLLLLLSASGIYKPKLAERVLRSYDVPPISGGPGKSRAGGFFVLMYIFAWTSFGICIFIQWAFFNEQARRCCCCARGGGVALARFANRRPRPPPSPPVYQRATSRSPRPAGGRRACCGRVARGHSP